MRFFTTAPAGQDYFKQSNTYLHVVADKIKGMTLEMYQNPVKMVDDISALGLRHVGYAIPTEFFGPFVSACVEVVMTVTTDLDCVESFRWSLGLISKMLVRTIQEGSTIVMKAINTNNAKSLRKAISCAPRGERNDWMLTIQVGTQSISPLAWSIESGALESAQSIILDLLTFRADRYRYYYGMDALFKRHPEIVQTLTNDAPTVLPKLLDGLIWRSRTTENGMRRSNYYLRHLLIDANERWHEGRQSIVFPGPEIELQRQTQSDQRARPGPGASAELFRIRIRSFAQVRSLACLRFFVTSADVLWGRYTYKFLTIQECCGRITVDVDKF